MQSLTCWLRLSRQSWSRGYWRKPEPMSLFMTRRRTENRAVRVQALTWHWKPQEAINQVWQFRFNQLNICQFRLSCTRSNCIDVVVSFAIHGMLSFHFTHWNDVIVVPLDILTPFDALELEDLEVCPRPSLTTRTSISSVAFDQQGKLKRTGVHTLQATGWHGLEDPPKAWIFSGDCIQLSFVLDRFSKFCVWLFRSLYLSLFLLFAIPIQLAHQSEPTSLEVASMRGSKETRDCPGATRNMSFDEDTFELQCRQHRVRLHVGRPLLWSIVSLMMTVLNSWNRWSGGRKKLIGKQWETDPGAW